MISRTGLQSLCPLALSMFIDHVIWQLTLLPGRESMTLDHVGLMRLLMLSGPLSIMNKLMYK